MVESAEKKRHELDKVTPGQLITMLEDIKAD